MHKRHSVSRMVSSLAILTATVSLAGFFERPAAAQMGGVGRADKPSIVRLLPDEPIWIDSKRKMVILDGEIVLREGALEVFACMRGTKEHESIIAVPTRSQIVHTALLAVGARQGTPVSWDPEYQPATGGVVDVLVQWKDEEGKIQTRRGKDWVRDNRTKESMTYDWIFAGSYFWEDKPLRLDEDEENEEERRPGKMIYAADGGELICVSNFPSAMLDLPIKSSDDNAELFFEAYTERIPPEGTKVRLFLIPQRETDNQEDGEQDSAQDQPKEASPPADAEATDDPPASDSE